LASADCYTSFFDAAREPSDSANQKDSGSAGRIDEPHTFERLVLHIACEVEDKLDEMRRRVDNS